MSVTSANCLKVAEITLITISFKTTKMLRRNVRLRKEYLYKKSLEEKENLIRERKARIQTAISAGNTVAPVDRHFEYEKRGKLNLEDANSLAPVSAVDDEYAFAGVKDPRILLTTSRDPSNRLQQFVKELNLIFPNSQRLNRGSYVIPDLVRLCQSNEISDIVVVHEHRGVPDGIVVSHMPLGPTVYFGLLDVVLRHDLPNKPPTMSTVAPHLILENFNTRLGDRIGNVLKYLFPPAAPMGQRVMTFVNRNDLIHFRHFVWTDERSEGAKQASYKNVIEGAVEEGKPSDSTTSSVHNKRGDKSADTAINDATVGREAAVKKRQKQSLASINLVEVGPRFILKPYRIELGTLDMKDLEIEWSLKPYFNKPKPALAS